VESTAPSYRGRRYQVEVVSRCVWLYHRFPLSFREVEELMLPRGVVVSCETVRRWCAEFGRAQANGLCRRRPRTGDGWHPDEVLIKINGGLKCLWRAVDQDGNVLDGPFRRERARRYCARSAASHPTADPTAPDHRADPRA
jgi:putative transposase